MRRYFRTRVFSAVVRYLGGIAEAYLDSRFGWCGGGGTQAWPPIPMTSFRTVAIKRGDLLSTISATGTVEPEEVVDVGAQVMGLILEFGPDPHDPAKLIDYGSVVEKGTVLAKIDPTPMKRRSNRPRRHWSSRGRSVAD